MTTLGLVLLVLGAVVAVTEAHYPTHGVAGGAGVAVMAAGAVLAISGLGAGLLVGLLVGAALAGAGAALVTLTVTRGLAVRRRRVSTGVEGIVGHVGVVRDWADGSGRIALDGALWRARPSPTCEEDEVLKLHSGDPVVVERVEGLTLSVRPAEGWE